jgi:hypothetical protein
MCSLLSNFFIVLKFALSVYIQNVTVSEFALGTVKKTAGITKYAGQRSKENCRLLNPGKNNLTFLYLNPC